MKQAITEDKINYTKTIILDSKSATNTLGSYTFKLSCDIDKIVGYKFNRIIVPNAFYTVTGATSTSAFANNVITTSAGTATIPTGNYNATSLATALQTQLQLIDANYTVAYAPLTGLFTIANAVTAFTITMSTYAAILFGIKSTTVAANSVTSATLPFLNRTKYITLNSNALSRYIQYNKHSDNRSYMITQIPIMGSFGDQEEYEIYNPKWYEFTNLREPINYIDIQFMDEYKQVVDFMGDSWTVEIEFLPQNNEFINYQ